MILQAGDLGIVLDTGTNAPGVPLERFEAGEWLTLQGGRRAGMLAGGAGEPAAWALPGAGMKSPSHF